jgi:hypothetical protein
MAANERLARRINEIKSFDRPRDGSAGHAFICECSREDCAERLDIGVSTYARVRRHPRRFIVRDGHENTDIESVVEAVPNCVIVEKHGEAGRLAEIDVSGL